MHNPPRHTYIPCFYMTFIRNMMELLEYGEKYAKYTHTLFLYKNNYKI
jgi:hypothetical protein